RTTVPYHHRQRLPLTLATLPRRLHRKSFDLPELATNPRSHARRSRPSTLDRRCSRTWTIPTRNAMRAFMFVLQTDAALAFGLIAVVDGQFAALVLIAGEPTSS